MNKNVAFVIAFTFAVSIACSSNVSTGSVDSSESPTINQVQDDNCSWDGDDCGDGEIMIVILDSVGDTLKSGLMGVFYPDLEEPFSEILESKNRVIYLDSAGIICLNLSETIKKYRIKDGRSISAFYLGMGNGASRLFLIPQDCERLIIPF